jgi:type VI secretion system protein ImpG
MVFDMNNENKNSFNRELNYLIDSFENFSKKHPSFSKKINLTEKGSDDPHVNLLLESFAFLTSKLQQQIDRNTQQIESFILDNICPMSNLPLLSKTVIHFNYDERQINALLEDSIIQKGTEVFSENENKIKCTFSTEFDVRLVPFKIDQVYFEKEKYIGNFFIKSSLVFKIIPFGCNFHDILAYDKLRIFINARENKSARILDIIFDNKTELYIYNKIENSVKKIHKNDIKIFPFQEYINTDGVPNDSHAGMRLLNDFSTFKKKFNFIEISNMSYKDYTTEIDLIFSFGDAITLDFPIKREMFLLNCCTAVNLYEKLSEPIKLDKFNLNYKFYSDHKNMKNEIFYYPKKIYCMKEDMNEIYDIRNIKELFDSYLSHDENETFFECKRDYTDFTEMRFSFYKKNGNFIYPDENLIYANIYLCNGEEAEKFQDNSDLFTENQSPISSIKMLIKPTKYIINNNKKMLNWKIVSSFNMNYMSFYKSEEMLKKINNLFFLTFGNGSEGLYWFYKSIKDVKIDLKYMSSHRNSYKGFILLYDIRIFINRSFLEDESIVLLGLFFMNIMKLFVYFIYEISITLIDEESKEIIYKCISS